MLVATYLFLLAFLSVFSLLLIGGTGVHCEAIPRNRDLRQRMPITGQDEIADSSAAINTFLENFQSVVTRISENARKTPMRELEEESRELHTAVGRFVV